MRNRTTIAALTVGLTLGFAAHAAEPAQSAPATDVTISGVRVAVDPSTGKLRPLTASEGKRLSDAMLKSAPAEARARHIPLNERETRLTQRTRRDGSVAVRAPLSSMTEMRAVVGADGNVKTYEAQGGSPNQAPVDQEETK